MGRGFTIPHSVLNVRTKKGTIKYKNKWDTVNFSNNIIKEKQASSNFVASVVGVTSLAQVVTQ